MRRVFGVAALTLLGTACSLAQHDGDAGASETGAEDTGEPGPAISSSSGAGESAETSVASGDMEPSGPPPARGIEVVAVTADQGVRVPIAYDEVVAGNERNAPIVAHRPLMLRAFYEVDEGFETRDIAAKLFIQQVDGTVKERTRVITVSERDCGDDSIIDCYYFSIPRSFWWNLPAEDVKPGATYRIELKETAPGHEDDVSDKSPSFPEDGSMYEIGIEDSYMKMRAVLVPIDHDLGADCPEPPDLSATYAEGSDGEVVTVADLFGQRLKAQNPVDEVEIIVHDTVTFTGSLESEQGLLSLLQELRFSDGAPPEYYYYGVARPCDDGPPFSGVAFLGRATQNYEGYRVGWGVFYDYREDFVAETFVHEIGHQQGRRHVACNGEASPDPSYPDPDGDILSWGTDVISGSLKVYRPTAHDYMTYCSDTWVSEWAWNKVYPWIEELSSWEFESRAEDRRALLVGTIAADGTQSFFSTYGAWDDEDAAGTIVARTRDGLLLEGTARVAATDHSDTVGIIAALPTSPEELTYIEVAHGTSRTRIDPAKVRAGSFSASSSSWAR